MNKFYQTIGFFSNAKFLKQVNLFNFLFTVYFVGSLNITLILPVISILFSDSIREKNLQF